MTLTFSGPGSPNQSCPRPRLLPAIGGRHSGRETCRSTTAQRADIQPELHQTLSCAREPDYTSLGSPAHTPHSGFTCEQRTTARHWCAQNADHFATSSPLSAFFTEVVCNVGTTPPRTAATPPPIGGIAPCKGATRRRHAASQLLMLQKPHHRHGGHREQGSPAAAPVSSAWAPP